MSLCEHMSKIGFIKNWESLQEDYRGGAFGFDEEQKILGDLLDSLPNKNHIIGYVGRFGTGKSTVLESLKNERQITEKWCQFDAWQYPERKDLWEYFVIFLAREILDKEKFKYYHQVIRGMKLPKHSDVFFNWLTAFVALQSPAFTPAPSVIKSVLKVITETDPLKRTEEFQILLKKIIKELDKDLVVVIEDIDRSNDGGIYFIETLSFFLRENTAFHKISIIVPIDRNIYLNNAKSLASYEKAIDLFVQSDLRPDFTRFVEDLVDKEVEENIELANVQIANYLEALYRELNVNIRRLKQILRNAANKFQSLKNDESFRYDWKLIILVESMKLILKDDNSNTTFFDACYSRNEVPSVYTPFGRLLWAIATGSGSLKVEGFHNCDIEILLTDNPLPEFRIDVQANARIRIDSRYLKI